MIFPGAIADRKVEYRDLRDYLDLLEKQGLLKHINAEVDLKHEIGAICARSLQRNGPALQFDNIKGYQGKPLVCNIMSTMEQLALIFNTEPDVREFNRVILGGLHYRTPSVRVDTGPCKEEKHFGNEIDLYSIPTPWWHELDGGQYVATQAGVVTRNKHTGFLNMGTYRGMIVDKKTMTLTGQVTRDVKDYEAAGQPTPVAIVIGMDPLLTLASGCAVPVDAEGNMEYEAAGTWRGAPTRLVKCETNDLLVPAEAEWVIEGEISAAERIPEGPHGEAGGFYGSHPEAYKVTVTAITHRKNPINYGCICLRQEDYPRWLPRSASALYTLTEVMGLKQIKDLHWPEIAGSNAGGMAWISADIQHPDEPLRLVREAWKIMPRRWVIIVDEDCDVRDWTDVMWRVVSSAHPGRDIITGEGPEPSARGEKAMDIVHQLPAPLGIDATYKFKFKEDLPMNKISRELMDRVAARWREFGLS